MTISHIRLPLPGVASRLREDGKWAAEHVAFTSVLGSPFVPRLVRQAALRLAGSHVGSGPGTGFSLSGSPRNLTVGSNVYFNKGVYIEAVGAVTIGDGCALGMQAMIVTSHHDIPETGGWSAEATGRPVSIGERVWIGARVVVLPGAVIEDDVVVAAGAVVTGRLLSHGVYAGVPARRIKELLPAVREPAVEVVGADAVDVDGAVADAGVRAA